MNRTRNPTFDQFAEYVEEFPATLSTWQRPGHGGVLTALASGNHIAALESTTPSNRTLDFLNAAGFVANWTIRYMSRKHDTHPLPSDIKQLWSTAIPYWNLMNCIAEVRNGLRDYEAKGRCIYLSYNGDLNLYALGLWLSNADGALEPNTETWHLAKRTVDGVKELVGTWLANTNGTKTWFCTPEKVREPLRKWARSIVEAAPIYLPPNTPAPVGGSLGAITAYWCELRALGLFNDLVLRTISPLPPTVAAAYQREPFMLHMARAAGITAEASRKITTFLTQGADRIRHPAITPLVQLDDGRLFPMSTLIIADSPHRNIQKILQANNKQYGLLGNRLGTVGEQIVSDVLKQRLAKRCSVATNIRVQYKKGRDATDLDVVVYSPRENLLVVLEVKWHLAVDGSYETLMIESAAREKQMRLEKRRNEVLSGAATVRWPRNWNLADGYDTRWFVITHDVLPTHNLGVSDIKIRPHKLLEHLLPDGASARELVALLDDPPTPVVNGRQWAPQRFGKLEVYVERANITPRQPRLFDLPPLWRYQPITAPDR